MDRGLSGRLAALLAHSGAVVLLQRSSMRYTFSSRLEPWVHYVPLTRSATDVAAKVLWLRDHDDMARQIVANAKAFGVSYLRQEDHLCYAASVLQTLARLQNGSTATEPFAPHKFQIDK